MKKAILLVLFCYGLLGCAQKQADPYEAAGYVRFPSNQPHVLNSTPSDPYSVFDMIGGLQQRILLDQQRNKQFLNQYYQNQGMRFPPLPQTVYPRQ